MEQVAEKVKELVHENNHEVYCLSAQTIELKVVQGAIGRLLHQLDEIVFKKWHEDRGIAAHSILETLDTVRLIDMAFYPLLKKMQESVSTTEKITTELFDIIIKPDGGKPSIDREPQSFEEVALYREVCNNVKKADAPTST